MADPIQDALREIQQKLSALDTIHTRLDVMESRLNNINPAINITPVENATVNANNRSIFTNVRNNQHNTTQHYISNDTPMQHHSTSRVFTNRKQYWGPVNPAQNSLNNQNRQHYGRRQVSNINNQRSRTIDQRQDVPRNTSRNKTQRNSHSQPQHETKNENFKETLKSIYRGCQLRHHRRVWDRVPEPISKKLDELMNFLTPPLPRDGTLINKLTALRDSFQDNLRAAIKDHLELHLNENKEKLINAELDERDKRAAIEIATRVMKRSNPKIPEQNIKSWVLEDVSVISNDQRGIETNRDPSNCGITPRCKRTHEEVSPDSDTTSVHNQNPSVYTEKAPKRRTLPSIPHRNTPALQNICEYVSQENSSYHEDDTDTSLLSSQDTTADINSLTPNHYIHDKRKKASWNLPISGKPEVIILADSNFRPARNIPSNWQIHVYPGAFLGDVAKLLEKSSLPDSVKQLVVAVGINHKRWSFNASTKPHLYKVTAAAEQHHRRIHFLGVSTNGLPATEELNIGLLNDEARRRVGDSNFIRPLPNNQVTISDSDPYQIHHTADTVDRIIQTIITHFSSLN